MIKRFFLSWSGRIQYIFTGEKRKETFPQRVLTANCVLWWKFWLFLICIGVLALMVPWPMRGRRIKVTGTENVRNLPPGNVLILPNHGSFLSPPLVTLLYLIARGLGKTVLHPQQYFPWQTPNVKIMDDSALFLGRLSPFILIESDKEGMPKDAYALIRIVRRLQKSTVVTFVEGTRSYHAREPKIVTSSGVTIGYPFWGAGALVYYCRPVAIPVLIKGEEKICHQDASIRSIAQKLLLSRSHLEVIFGRPMDISWVPQQSRLISNKKLKEIAITVSERIVQEIAALDVRG